MDAMRDKLLMRFADLSRSGFRVIGIASRDIDGESKISKVHECDMERIIHSDCDFGCILLLREI